MEPVVSRKSEGGYARDGQFFLWVVDFRTQRHRMEPGGGRRIKGCAAKQLKDYVHGAQADEAVLRTEEAVLDARRRNASWEVADFSPGYGPDVCSYGYYSGSLFSVIPLPCRTKYIPGTCLRVASTHDE